MTGVELGSVGSMVASMKLEERACGLIRLNTAKITMVMIGRLKTLSWCY